MVTYEQVVEVIREDNADRLRAMLQELDPRVRDDDGRSLTQRALRFGSTATLAVLLDRGAPLEADLQLAAAIVLGDEPLVRTRLIPAELDRVNRMGETALMVAVRMHALEVIDRLLAAGASTEVRHEWRGNILETAAEGADPRVVERLLRGGASVHAENGHGDTPLFAMVCHFEDISPDRLACVQLLIRAGARIHYRYDAGQNRWVDNCVLCAVAGNHRVFSDGHAAALQLLLDAGGPPLLQERGTDALFHAIAKGHLRAVEMLLAAGVPANAIDKDGHPMLLTAIRFRQPDVLALLLRSGASVPAMAAGGRALLLEAREKDPRLAALLAPYDDAPGEYATSLDGLNDAIDAGDLEAVERLLDGGLDAAVERLATGYAAAVSAAAARGHSHIVRALVARGADLEASGESGHVLEAAVGGRHVDCVRTLIALGCNVNANPRSSKAHGPLWFAAHNCELEIVRLLLAAGAEPYLDFPRQTFGREPSQEHGYEETMDLLLTAMRDPVRRRTTLEHALYAAVYDQSLRDVRYFLERAPELLVGPDDVRMMLFEGAAVRGDAEMLGFLLSLGPYSLEIGDLTPLMHAALKGKPAAVRVLVEAGANVRARSSNGFTPLMYACYQMRSGYPAIVEYLLAHGAEVDVRAWDGRTALLMAVASGPYGVVQALLRRGPDLSVRDRKGLTALDIAERRGDANMLDLLRDSLRATR